MTTLSSQPYKGTRDWYPDEKAIQNYIFDVWRQTVKSFGFQEYGAPLLEPLEIYAAKSGEELVNDQTYTFTDRGERQVAIRPEMTPSISRMVAARRQEMTYPARLYSIANFLRYERPQRGREREFWQLNIDVFGDDSVAIEAELLILADRIMRNFGARSGMYRIRLNNRALIDVIMRDYLGLAAEQIAPLVRLIDRKDKLSHDDFTSSARELLGDNEKIAKLEQVLAIKSLNDLPDALKTSESYTRVAQLFGILQAAGIDTVEFDVSLMRGLDYYTGMVFEVFDTDPENNRSLFGGGRYDGLVGMFGVEPISAVGFAPGYSMTEIFLASHGLLPELTLAIDLAVVTLPGGETYALQLANNLRQNGLNVDVDYTDRKLDKKIKSADKKQISYLAVVGPDESDTSIVTIKDLANRTEERYSLSDAVAFLLSRRSK